MAVAPRTYQDRKGTRFGCRHNRLNADGAVIGTVAEAATDWIRSVGISASEDVAKFHSYEAAAEVYDRPSMRRATALVNDFVFNVDADGKWVKGTGHNPHVHMDGAWLSVFVATPALRSARPGGRAAKVDPDFIIKVVYDALAGAWLVVKSTTSRVDAKTMTARRNVNAALLGADEGRPVGARQDPNNHLWLTPESIGYVELAEDASVGGDEAVHHAQRWQAELAADFFEAESAEYAGFTGTGTYAGPRNGFAQEAPFSPDRLAWLGGHNGESDFLSVIDRVDAEMAAERDAEERTAHLEGWADEEDGLGMPDDAFLEWADAQVL